MAPRTRQRWVWVVSATVLAAMVAHATALTASEKCSACDAVAVRVPRARGRAGRPNAWPPSQSELARALRLEKPHMNVDIRSRLDSKGKRQGKVRWRGLRARVGLRRGIPRARRRQVFDYSMSELRATELLEVRE